MDTPSESVRPPILLNRQSINAGLCFSNPSLNRKHNSYKRNIWYKPSIPLHQSSDSSPSLSSQSVIQTHAQNLMHTTHVDNTHFRQNERVSKPHSCGRPDFKKRTADCKAEWHLLSCIELCFGIDFSFFSHKKRQRKENRKKKVRRKDERRGEYDYTRHGEKCSRYGRKTEKKEKKIYPLH